MVAHRHEPLGRDEPHLLELGRSLQDCSWNIDAVGFDHGAGDKTVAVRCPVPKNHVSSGNPSKSRDSDGGLEAELEVETFQTAARAATEMSSANTLRLARLPDPPRYIRRTESGDTSPYEDDLRPAFGPSMRGA
jgi:hypothetical protein